MFGRNRHLHEEEGENRTIKAKCLLCLLAEDEDIKSLEHA